MHPSLICCCCFVGIEAEDLPSLLPSAVVLEYINSQLCGSGIYSILVNVNEGYYVTRPLTACGIPEVGKFSGPVSVLRS